MKLDLTKPIQTRDGRSARFLGNVKDEDFPLVFAVSTEEGGEYVSTYSEKGVCKHYYYPRIINILTKTVVYLICYKHKNDDIVVDSLVTNDKKSAESILKNYLKKDSNFFMQEVEIVVPEGLG